MSYAKIILAIVVGTVIASGAVVAFKAYKPHPKLDKFIAEHNCELKYDLDEKFSISNYIQNGGGVAFTPLTKKYYVCTTEKGVFMLHH